MLKTIFKPKFFKLVLSYFILTNLISCISVLPKLDPQIKYQRDLPFDVEFWEPSREKWIDKKHFVGVGVIPIAPRYKIRLYAVGKADMMVLQSCHREIKTPDPDRKGWLKNKYYEFEFSLDELIEKDKDCIITLGVYEKVKGRHGWAMIAINWSKSNMPSEIRCNGNKSFFNGTSFCQAKNGLVQMITFDREVDTTFYGDCRIDRSENGRVWQYFMPRGKCILHFFDANDESFEHVHYMYGYDTIPIRGVE